MLAEIDFGEILWTTVVIFFMIAYLMILFRVIFDIFRNHEMSGGMKAVWLIALLVLPVLTLFIYVIAHGNDMAQRDIAQQKAAEADFRSTCRRRPPMQDPRPSRQSQGTARRRLDQPGRVRRAEAQGAVLI